ncbi:hypothetical protein AAAU27_10345 [Bacteroides ovatus]|uniref:hypothetical protein n=1 Tax=Bacteroides ovatus TaxID=28116 RepID=UPI0032BFC13A
MKQKEFFGKGEKHVYVRKGDNNEILVTRTKNDEIITEENTVHLDAEEARKLGIQLLKLGSEELPKSGIDLKAESFVDKITVYRGINPDETPDNLAVITIDESDEARQVREDSGEEPGFSIEGEELEKLISALAKIV